jgi:SAM-dependent methyltransferase
MVLIKYLERINNFNINRNAGDEYMDRNPVVTLRGKHVVDLGSGTGVTSIAAALLGANSVTCTDGEEPVVRLARDNILRASNQLSESISSEETLSSTADGDENNTVTIDACPIRAQKFWWGTEFSPTLKSGSQDNGIAILVADCVLPKLYPIAPLVQAIDDCLRLHHDDEEKYQEATESQARSSSFAIVSYEHRYYPKYDPRIEFRRLASERCLDVFTVPRDEMDPVYSLDDVEIWIVRRKSVQCSKK